MGSSIIIEFWRSAVVEGWLEKERLGNGRDL